MSRTPLQEQAPIECVPAGVLLVDLDEVLLAARPRAEAAIEAVRSDPRKLLQFGRAILRGPEGLQTFLDACLATYPADYLPVHENVLALLRARQRAGGQLVFLTSLPREWATIFFARLGLSGELLSIPGRGRANQDRKLAAAQAWCTQAGLPSPKVLFCDSAATISPSAAPSTPETATCLLLPPPTGWSFRCVRRWRRCGRISGSRVCSSLCRCWLGTNGGRHGGCSRRCWRWWRSAQPPRRCTC